MSKPFVAVAMSGGVDSSTVAALLHREGYRIVGMTMQLWNQRRLPELAVDGPNGRCCSLDDVYDARHVAEEIGIPYYVVNFEDRFEEQVVQPFVQDYLEGRTPIPCTLCNNFIKFDQFIEMADSVGSDKIATGHYAQVDQDAETGRYQLKRAADWGKDQTYFLFGLNQLQLSRTLFPLGHLTKDEVRKLALDLQVPIANKPESQEICFVPNGDYAAFIEAYFKDKGIESGATRGEIVTEEGNVVGEHNGVHHFTVGQRRGIGIATGERLYVIETKPDTQEVVIGHTESLMHRRMLVREMNWISIAQPDQPVRAKVRIRNKHVPAAATIMPANSDGVHEVLFDEPQRAITPGQGAVAYQGELVLAGGWIDRVTADK
jgi:tRNA-specific 2-thiouridylase